jgi:hypothetical protein
MRDIEASGPMPHRGAWHAARAIAGTTVLQFVVTLLLALALLLASPFANG